MIISVNIRVPEGPTCYFKDGKRCQWTLCHSGSGQRWCRIFNDARLERSGEKCQQCREVCEQQACKNAN